MPIQFLGLEGGGTVGFVRRLEKAVAVPGICSELPDKNSGHRRKIIGRERTTLNPKAGKSVPVFWPLFPLYAGAFFL